MPVGGAAAFSFVSTSDLRVELAPVTITGGLQVALGQRGGYHVPKCPAGQMETLRKELEGMERRARSSGAEDLSGKRSGVDDVVMALLPALWRMLAAHRGTVNRQMLGRPA